MHAIKDMIHFDGAPPISFGKMGIGTSGWREGEEGNIYGEGERSWYDDNM